MSTSTAILWDSVKSYPSYTKIEKKYPSNTTKAWVTEAEYWQNYYNYPDKIYEWNNGVLEEKGVSSICTYHIYHWFILLLDHYLKINPEDEMVHMEMGFSFQLTDKKVIRRPDIGIVSRDNPLPLKDDDISYSGLFDICIEAVSDSNRAQLERDIIVKKQEYAQAGVQEYFILYEDINQVEFYQLKGNTYNPITKTDGIIQSNVLPGFQFRFDDLFKQPTVEEMINDPVYKDFVGLSLQKANKIATQEKQRANELNGKLTEEKQRANELNGKLTEEKQRANEAEQKIIELQAFLAKNNLTL